jgi:hypothetical protein
MGTPGNAGQFEFCAGWVVARLAWNRDQSRHEALIAMASRGGFLSPYGAFLSGENIHLQLLIKLQLNRKSRLVSGRPNHCSEMGKGEFSGDFCESCFPFFAYLLSQRCKKTQQMGEPSRLRYAILQVTRVGPIC